MYSSYYDRAGSGDGVVLAIHFDSSYNHTPTAAVYLYPNTIII